MKYLLLTLFILPLVCFAQNGYWQQRADYTMDITVDVRSNSFQGKEQINYTNHAPDTLDRIYLHLYWNAFRPGSMMDEHSRDLGKRIIGKGPDWDPRIADRISRLKPEEMGSMTVRSVTIDGLQQELAHRFDGTILEVKLSQPLLPQHSMTLDVDFFAQVPLQVRRSGRDNPETQVQYSMSQWYPKVCEYDKRGWHPVPYVAREFYGVWGNFDVSIFIDERYKLGGTGVLQNAESIGWGYDRPGTSLKQIDSTMRRWHFKAENVHDFVWAADTGYHHLVRESTEGTKIHTIYKYRPQDSAREAGWKYVADVTIQVLPFIEKTFGAYPYPQYSFIQGGDGGMEYPMATLISGFSLGTVFHEWMHSWYQTMLATNESLYPWMDEGFTEFATCRVYDYYYWNIRRKELLEYGKTEAIAQGDTTMKQLPLYYNDEYDSYFKMIRDSLEEPLTTHADHYETTRGYGPSVYSKGCIFLVQLGYIMGDSLRDKLLIDYYNTWRFKHPDDQDFLRLAEMKSGMKLDWYNEYWIQTTKHIDYAIDSVTEDQHGNARVHIRRIGEMPMPVDLVVMQKSGKKYLFHIPLDMMLGEKQCDNYYDRSYHWRPAGSWQWTNRIYILETGIPYRSFVSAEIDLSQRMADIDRNNNRVELK